MRRISGLMGMLVAMAVTLPQTAVAQGAHRPAAAAAGALPFTGLDLVLLLAGVSALVTAGLVVRRAAARFS